MSLNDLATLAALRRYRFVQPAAAQVPLVPVRESKVARKGAESSTVIQARQNTVCFVNFADGSVYRQIGKERVRIGVVPEQEPLRYRIEAVSLVQVQTVATTKEERRNRYGSEVVYFRTEIEGRTIINR